MAVNNQATLGRALQLYRAGMQRLVQQRLMSIHRRDWWEKGVLTALTPTQRTNLVNETKRADSGEPQEYLEPVHFQRIINGRAFEDGFKDIFSDYNETQGWLLQIAAARNRWAHARSGDLPADEVAHVLYAIVRLLRAARQPEAEEIERLRNSVLLIEPSSDEEAGGEAQVSTPRAVAPAPSGQTPFWWQVCEPHDAFKNPATIDESLFAATLGGVHAGAARREYLDPAIFFAHTYFTENLRQTIRDVASRLHGGDGPAVTELQTPFGGGKTHALLTLYHLVRNASTSLAVPDVKEAIGDVSIPPTTRVLVFDGQEWGTEPLEKADTTTVCTLWGELTYQANPALFQRLMRDSDSRGDAPGNALFRQVLEQSAPCLILIDELVSYLVKLRFSSTKRTQNLYRQTIQFIQELLQEAGNLRGVVVLLSLPKSTREFGGLDPADLQQQLGVIPDLQARADRVVSKRTPVNDDEIYTLMSKRLFRRIDTGVAARVAQQYRETYERSRNLYDDAVFTPEWQRQQVAAYPLHPELIDTLYKKWSTASDFPRTRAVLQLLANIVADQWINRREAYAIHTAHVNLERERIRTRIVSAAGSGGGYDAVVAADIIGGDAHADMQDQRRGGDYERHHIARGIATTLLMHSFGGSNRAGAITGDLYLGTVAPNVGPEYVSEILDSLEQSLWYVHREGELLRFQTRPNIYRMIAQNAEQQPAALVVERLREAVGKVIGTATGFRVLEWAGEDGQISDRPEPAIAVLSPRYAVAAGDGDRPGGAGEIERLWNRAGGGLRQWRNALLLVAPDADLWSKTDEAMREVLAYESVMETARKRAFEVSQNELKDLASRAKDKQESLSTSVATTYRWAFAPGETGLQIIALPVPAVRGERIVERVVARLSDINYGPPKILDRMSADYFNSKFAPRLWQDEDTPLDLGELRRRFPQWTYLPVLLRPEIILRECIGEGLRRNPPLWGVAIGDASRDSYRQLITRPDDLTAAINPFDGTAYLVRGALLDLIREQLKPSPEPESRQDQEEKPVTTGDAGTAGQSGSKNPDPVIVAPKRFTRVRLEIDGLSIAKTLSLQPYLFKHLQSQDPGATLHLTLDVQSAAGISAETLDERVVQGLEQLGISITWKPS